jgi:NAD(P)-dependent dehydrogenase (short-subunit alcohol dehydrogenase family)
MEQLNLQQIKQILEDVYQNNPHARFFLLGFLFLMIYRFLTMKYFKPPVKNGLVIVTGCTAGGMGETIAVDLCKQNFHVLAGVRKESYGEELLNLHPDLKEFLHPVIVDVAKDESVAALAENFEIKYLKKYNVPLVGIVNNAGIGYPMPIEIADTQKCSDVFNVNVVGIIRMTKAFTKYLRESQGRIVNIGSATGTMAMQCDGPYASSKFAGEGLSDSMRLELMKWGISVSLIVVGQIKTNMWGKLTGKNAPASTEVKKTSVEHELYGELFGQVEKAVGTFQGTLSPPTVVSRAVVHGITSSYPKTRYVVAKISGIPVILLRNLIPFFPDRIVDFIKLNL